MSSACVIGERSFVEFVRMMSAMFLLGSRGLRRGKRSDMEIEVGAVSAWRGDGASLPRFLRDADWASPPTAAALLRFAPSRADTKSNKRRQRNFLSFNPNNGDRLVSAA